MKWTKSSDWLPVTNALAQVAFWKDDLKKAERTVHIFEIMKVPRSDKLFKVALLDVQVSKDGLKRSQEKLKSTYKRVFGRTL